jgi:hypothetical protein
MDEERRFTEQEVAEILERATLDATDRARPAAQSGLTLGDLQEIGREVGIPAERVAAAARSVSLPTSNPPPAEVLGRPRSVSRVVRIPRALTEDEWTRLVVDLRETFGAVGSIESHGPLRSWTNGNLQIHVEPDGDAYRVRMRTVKGDALAMVYSGIAVGLTGPVMALLSLAAGKLDAVILVLTSLLFLMGVGQFGYAMTTLPRWAAARTGQMEGLAERIPLLLKD